MDSTLTAGLLERLDAVAQAAGVAANEVWSIWLATSWRPMVGLLPWLFAALVLAVASRKVFQRSTAARERWEATPESHRSWRDDDAAAQWFALGVFLVVASCFVLFVASGIAVDAIAYLLEPRLYALDQLRGLIGE